MSWMDDRLQGLFCTEDGHQDDDEAHNMYQKPREYIQNRLQQRLDGVRHKTERMEQKMEDGDPEELEVLAEGLSDVYDLQESMNESMQRETDVAMERVGLNAHAHKMANYGTLAHFLEGDQARSKAYSNHSYRVKQVTEGRVEQTAGLTNVNR